MMGDRRATLIVFLVLCSISVSLLNIEAVSAAEDSWEIMADVPTGRLGLGVAAVNGKIYVIGGMNQYGELNVNEEYDPANDSWTTKTRMPTPRNAFAIAVYDNKIYCIGGGGDFGLEEVTGITEVYDPLTDTWETKAPMPTARQFMDANVVDGKIYVIGGSKPINFNDPSYVPNINEVYDPETDEWSPLKAPPVKVSNHASAVCDSKIYIFSKDLTQIFDPQTNSWSNGTSMPHPGWGAVAGATTGDFAPKRIYVLGGNPTFGYNQIYDPETDSWNLGAFMPTGRYGLGVAVIDDVVYAIGGPGADAMVSNERYTPVGYIPEFSSWTRLLITLVTIMAVAVSYRRKLSKANKRRGNQ
jgi:N-acetylneuraminic acid mutarotase